MLHKAIVLGADVVGHRHEVYQQRQDHGRRGACGQQVLLCVNTRCMGSVWFSKGCMDLHGVDCVGREITASFMSSSHGADNQTA